MTKSLDFLNDFTVHNTDVFFVTNQAIKFVWNPGCYSRLGRGSDFSERSDVDPEPGPLHSGSATLGICIRK